MSHWTYVHGAINVHSPGRTQAEMKYILDTVLEHLPVVSGSERDMEVYVVDERDYNSSVNCDEFGQQTNNLRDRYGNRNRLKGCTYEHDYILVVDGSLRDREFNETYREFQKWLCRLAKRIMVENVVVEISDYSKTEIITDKNRAYQNMYELPSWSWANKTGESNWNEYLMWKEDKNTGWPRILAYKYFYDEENDKKVEAWIKEV